MSNTDKAYKEAGMLPPAHAVRVSPDLHVVHPEVQPITAAPEVSTTSRTTSSSRASAPASTTTPKEA